MPNATTRSSTLSQSTGSRRSGTVDAGIRYSRSPWFRLTIGVRFLLQALANSNAQQFVAADPANPVSQPSVEHQDCLKKWIGRELRRIRKLDALVAGDATMILPGETDAALLGRTCERLAAGHSSDLAYGIFLEKADTRLAGAEGFHPMALRVAHIYRREQCEWKIIQTPR